MFIDVPFGVRVERNMISILFLEKGNQDVILRLYHSRFHVVKTYYKRNRPNGEATCEKLSIPSYASVRLMIISQSGG